MKTLLKSSGEFHTEFDHPAPVEWKPTGKFVALRAEPVHAALQPGAMAHPLLPPTISGTTETIDFALQNPTRVITPMLIDLTLQRFFVDRAFASGGGVTGGAVIYNVLEANDLYAERDVQMVAPGAEYPIITFQRRVPSVAAVEKWGGKFSIEWEARDRNDVGEFTRAVRQLANTIVRKINQRGLTVLDAAVTAYSRTISGVSWGTATTTTAANVTPAAMPARDFALVQQTADVEEMGLDGVTWLWIINPAQFTALSMVYGDNLDTMLAAHNAELFVTNRVTAGSAYVVAEGMVGEMRLERPLETRSWDDPNGIEQTWVQSSVRPLFFVNNPFALYKVTGLT